MYRCTMFPNPHWHLTGPSPDGLEVEASPEKYCNQFGHSCRDPDELILYHYHKVEQ